MNDEQRKKFLDQLESTRNYASKNRRDPARIPRLLNLLREVWSVDADARLGQILVNATTLAHQSIGRDTSWSNSETFYVEDDLVEVALEKLVGSRPEQPNQKIVINTRIGGFSLTRAAFLRLRELGCIEALDEPDYGEPWGHGSEGYGFWA
jgi:hypothetical protein